MKKTLARFVAVSAICFAVAGITSLQAGRKSVPPPPPDVLCGCACPDGSIIVTHAPSADQCESVCATVCDNTM
jgi:hypothetical protein